MEGSPNVLAFGLRGHPVQSGLGSLSVLPAEIRSQIWNIALPQTDRRIELAPLAKRNWTVLARWPEKRRNRNTLAFARASKRLYDEVMAQFFHKRSLAVVFAGILLASRQRAFMHRHTRDPGKRGKDLCYELCQLCVYQDLD